MKKRYIASPLLLVAIAVAWNVTLRSKTPVANAQVIQSYMAPKPVDARHPIDVFTVGIDGGETESDVLAHLPTTIYPQDKVTFKIDPRLGLGTIVHIERAMPVSIHYGRKKFDNYRTWSNTVEEVLAEKDLTLTDLDKTNHANSDIFGPRDTDITQSPLFFEL